MISKGGYAFQLTGALLPTDLPRNAYYTVSFKSPLLNAVLFDLHISTRVCLGKAYNIIIKLSYINNSDQRDAITIIKMSGTIQSYYYYLV